MFGNNLVEIIVTSSDESLQKIYTIETYRRTREESEIYNQKQEDDREKVKEIIEDMEELKDLEHIDEAYTLERTGIEVNYKTNNENMKIGILSFILIILIIGIVIKNLKDKK